MFTIEKCLKIISSFSSIKIEDYSYLGVNGGTQPTYEICFRVYFTERGAFSLSRIVNVAEECGNIVYIKSKAKNRNIVVDARHLYFEMLSYRENLKEFCEKLIKLFDEEEKYYYEEK